MRLLRGFVYLLVLLVITYFGLAYYVDYQLAHKDFSDAFNDCRKVWTARGLYGGEIKQNSIESIGRAFERGAMGVEVDIHYDVKLKDYIVSHSRPYDLKNGQILPLGKLFDAVGKGRYFWLDFKKLRRLDKAQALEAVQRLIDISQVHGVMSRIYVEGENPTNLSHFNNAGFHSIFDTHPAPDNHFLAPFMITVYKIFYYFGDYTVMGIEYGEIDNPVYGENARARLGNIPVFLYHLPVDGALIDEMLQIDAVRAFIVGNNQSVDFHDKNNCSSTS